MKWQKGWGSCCYGALRLFGSHAAQWEITGKQIKKTICCTQQASKHGHFLGSLSNSLCPSLVILFPVKCVLRLSKRSSFQIIVLD